MNSTREPTGADKTDAGTGSKAICRVSNVLHSPSPDPTRSAKKLMHLVDRTSLIEHVSFACSLSLPDCCERIREALRLPEFSFDQENETEWGIVEIDNLEYNVSRPYDDGKLQEWDVSVPPGCNFGMSMIVYREHPRAGDHAWAFDSLVVPVSEALVINLRTPIFYHRTWFGAGKNTTRDLIFEYPPGRTSRR